MRNVDSTMLQRPNLGDILWIALHGCHSEKEISNFISTEIEWMPINSVIISKEKNDDLINFFESLEEEDDVQNVFSNAEFL